MSALAPKDRSLQSPGHDPPDPPSSFDALHPRRQGARAGEGARAAGGCDHSRPRRLSIARAQGTGARRGCRRGRRGRLWRARADPAGKRGRVRRGFRAGGATRDPRRAAAQGRGTGHGLRGRRPDAARDLVHDRNAARRAARGRHRGIVGSNRRPCRGHQRSRQGLAGSPHAVAYAAADLAVAAAARGARSWPGRDRWRPSRSRRCGGLRGQLQAGRRVRF